MSGYICLCVTICPMLWNFSAEQRPGHYQTCMIAQIPRTSLAHLETVVVINLLKHIFSCYPLLIAAFLVSFPLGPLHLLLRPAMTRDPAHHVSPVVLLVHPHDTQHFRHRLYHLASLLEVRQLLIDLFPGPRSGERPGTTAQRYVDGPHVHWDFTGAMEADEL